MLLLIDGVNHFKNLLAVKPGQKNLINSKRRKKK